MRIEARAPTRIDLSGGTLDIWPLYLFHIPAVTVNCAITRYASCTIEARRDRKLLLESRDTHRSDEFDSLDDLSRARRYRLPLLSRLIQIFGLRTGLRLVTNSEAPAGAGIGGSSAMAVAICAALDRLVGWKRSRVDWVHISRDVEAIVIGVPTGTQDHYPAAFGGINAIVYQPGGEERVPLRVSPSELEKRLVLCYTGKPRQSGINNWKVFQAHINGDRRIRQNLARIASVSTAMAEAISSSQWKEAGCLMREEWNFRRRNLPSISTPTIDRIIASARRNGALAGKVCGAGGGGCVALLIEPDSRVRVEAAVGAAGGEVLPMKIDRHGVRIRVFART